MIRLATSSLSSVLLSPCYLLRCCLPMRPFDFHALLDASAFCDLLCPCPAVSRLAIPIHELWSSILCVISRASARNLGQPVVCSCSTDPLRCIIKGEPAFCPLTPWASLLLLRATNRRYVRPFYHSKYPRLSSLLKISASYVYPALEAFDIASTSIDRESFRLVSEVQPNCYPMQTPDPPCLRMYFLLSLRCACL
jgi:hypothetical protein